MDDNQAIARLKRGDITGLEALVERYQVKAVHTAVLITRDRALAEDVVQAAFLKAYERIGGFDAGRPFAPWFMRIVTNDALKAVTRGRPTLPLLEEAFPDPEQGPHAAAEAADLREQVRAALDDLSPEQRRAVVMRYFLDMSEDDMVDELDASRGTIKWRLHAARKRLRGLLEGG